MFLYKELLGRSSNGWTTSSARSARRGCRWLTEAEVRAVLAQMDGRHALMAGILYAAGLRLVECVPAGQGGRLRVFQITVRDGKGEKDRVTMLRALLEANLLAHLERVKAVHQKDLVVHGLDGAVPVAQLEPELGDGQIAVAVGGRVEARRNAMGATPRQAGFGFWS